ncbi:hypothetical protein IJ425_06510 [bacterium]|nr:hypothetical protein [bacterium]
MKKTLALLILGIAAVGYMATSSAFATTYNVTPKAPKVTASLKPIVAKYRQRNYVGAMQDLEELVKVEKNNTYAKYYLALCYTRLGFKDEAKILYQEVINKDENLTLSHYSQQALDCLENPDNQACKPPSVRAAEAEQLEPSDIDIFINSGRRIHPNAQDRITKERMERKLEEDEYIRRQIEEEKIKAGMQVSAVPTNEEIASALNTLSKIGMNPYTQFNPLAQAQQFSQYGALGLMGNNPMSMYGNANDMNPNSANMLLYAQLMQNKNGLMNYGI